jgi:hypothetical protein
VVLYHWRRGVTLLSPPTPPKADIFSLDIDSPDTAILTYTVHGTKCRIVFGESQVVLLAMMAARTRDRMREAQRISAIKG